MTPAVTLSDTGACSFAERNLSWNLISAPLAPIASENTLSVFRQLGVETIAPLSDFVHEIYEHGFAVNYNFATTNISKLQVGEKTEIVPNPFKEITTLPAKAQWKAASDKKK